MAGIYQLKVNNRNTKTRCEICSKLKIKIQERRHWHRSGVFIVNFEHISQLPLVLLLINFSSETPSGLVPSLKHGSKLKCFVLIFRKLEEINMWHWAKWQPSKILRSFLSSYFSYARGYKAALSGGNKNT